MKCQRTARSASSGAALPTSSCARFSPKSSWPRAARARTSAAGQVLLTASRATYAGSRPAARAAASMRARTARRFSRDRPRAILPSADGLREPDEAGLAAGDAVAAVGEQLRVLDGAARVVHDLADAGPAQQLREAGPQVQPGRAPAGGDGGRRGDGARPPPAWPRAPRSRRRRRRGRAARSRAAPAPRGSPWPTARPGTTPCRTPSRPAWTAATTPASWSASRIGTQSATSTHEDQPAGAR